MMTISSSREPQCMADINITPFTDVLLVLLIIFVILAAVTAPPGFQKHLSNTPPKHVSDPPLGSHQVMVEVTANDRISLDGKVIRVEQLYQKMAATSHFMTVMGIAATSRFMLIQMRTTTLASKY